MAFLPGLLGATLPFLGRALSGAVGGLIKGVESGKGALDVLKETGLGALHGAIGQPDDEQRVDPRPIDMEKAPEMKPKRPKPQKHQGAKGKVKLPKLVKHKKKHRK